MEAEASEEGPTLSPELCHSSRGSGAALMHGYSTPLAFVALPAFGPAANMTILLILLDLTFGDNGVHAHAITSIRDSSGTGGWERRSTRLPGAGRSLRS